MTRDPPTLRQGKVNWKPIKSCCAVRPTQWGTFSPNLQDRKTVRIKAVFRSVCLLTCGPLIMCPPRWQMADTRTNVLSGNFSVSSLLAALLGGGCGVGGASLKQALNPWVMYHQCHSRRVGGHFSTCKNVSKASLLSNVFPWGNYMQTPVFALRQASSLES